MVIDEKLDSTTLTNHIYKGLKDKPLLLVGNGPMVRDNEWGERIDEYFPTIVRLNGAIVSGHEKHIGAKAHMWFYNFQIRGSINSIKELHQEDRGVRMFVVYPMTNHPDHGKFETFFEAYHKHVPWCYTDIKVHREAMRYTSHRPTMGLLSLIWLLKHGFTNIYFYGFNMLDGKDFDGRHYDGRPGGFYKGTGHRPWLDKRAFERAIDYGYGKVWRGEKPK
jgi:hypothetical protein